MWSETAFTHLVDITYPIVQAPVFGSTTPELVAAVSEFGGLGTLSTEYLPLKELKKQVKKIKKLTEAPYALEVIVPSFPNVSEIRREALLKVLDPVKQQIGLKKKKTLPQTQESFTKLLEFILTEDIPVVRFSSGVLDEAWVERFKEKGTILIGTASSKEEAKLLQDLHFDAICLKGAEASGNRPTFIGRDEDFLIPLDVLISDCNASITKPLIAEGCIMDGEDILNVLHLGACAVQMSTAFITTHESEAPKIYKEVLLQQEDLHTILTRSLTGKLTRCIPNALTDYLEKFPFQILEYPVQFQLLEEIFEFALKSNDPNYMFMEANDHFLKCRKKSVNELLDELLEEIND